MFGSTKKTEFVLKKLLEINKYKLNLMTINVKFKKCSKLYLEIPRKH